MEQQILMDVLVLVRRMVNAMDEILELSNQLAEALERGDQVVIRMYLSMREQPIQMWQRTDHELRHKLAQLPSSDAKRLSDLLNGANAQFPHENPLVEQVASMHRLRQRVLETERILTQKMARKKSV